MKSFVLIILLQVFVFTKGGGENPETNLAVPPNTTKTTPSEVLSQLAQSLTPSPESPNTVMPVPPLNATVDVGVPQSELTMTTTTMPTTITTEETTTTNTTGAPSTEPTHTSYFIIGPPVQDVVNTNTPTPETTPTTPEVPTTTETPTTTQAPTTTEAPTTPTTETTTTTTLPPPSPAPQPPFAGASTATMTWSIMAICLTMVLLALSY